MSDIFELCANVIEAFLIAQFFIRYFKFKNENYKILKILMFTMAVMFVVTIMAQLSRQKFDVFIMN